MKLGMIGLGKMGYNLVLNCLDHGHEVVAFDVHPEPAQKLEQKGAIAAASIEELASKLKPPRVVWMMVPAGETVDLVLEQLVPHLSRGDIVIDGGNSNYKHTLARAEKLQANGLHYMDVGTSGGTSGAREGGCFMIGGNPESFRSIEPIFKDIAVKNGYLYAGEVGSGHFLKMVHNGIEYGMMQAIGEGFEILDKSPFNYNYEDVARVWANGSVIRGWLMELTQNAFSKDPNLEEIRGVMQASGEGQWTVETALEQKASAPVIAMSLFMRFRSLEEDTFHGKVVAALRNEFGGHAVVKK
ncbi:phosphogluconate dehydrogenase (NAD(+)-dependent, decarboxylating) [Paenactinomyces guangxiensis]|uniref:Decarboxylating 6-phosphogluconate dehydrogenase n=1 Tax=Paenactinomyces guangxiensis TaxID=1490290 RepID=A0A7W1WSS3_9BACL|nr:decarboxylating 6-phosphogluconate dehydrogenase [Paenactinomyces guangxiensis]MBA4495313.1 decarboxylating 6-phosphogluconate dehydrogenase [Paenactinomyces guangxiensis]MBH8592565.1 decarboxylating 6-phosphogluconate dehydrogenase [Paenactinomyces guangxiensis]